VERCLKPSNLGVVFCQLCGSTGNNRSDVRDFVVERSTILLEKLVKSAVWKKVNL
jgi:hypothetical protein